MFGERETSSVAIPKSTAARFRHKCHSTSCPGPAATGEDAWLIAQVTSSYADLIRREHQRQQRADRRRPGDHQPRCNFAITTKYEPDERRRDTGNNGRAIGDKHQRPAVNAFGTLTENETGYADQQRRDGEIGKSSGDEQELGHRVRRSRG